MAVMYLSISSIPSSNGGVAAIDLIVSVTDADGVAYTGLQNANFQVSWLADGVAQPLQTVSVQELGAPLSGLYDVFVASQGTSWTLARNVVTIFLIAVKEDQNRSQILYTPSDELLAALV